MSLFRRSIGVFTFAFVVSLPVVARAQGTGIPNKLSQFQGWHGATVDQTHAPNCRVNFPREFGKSPSDLRLLQQLANQGYEIDDDLPCLIQTGPYAAWDQLKRLAVEDQFRKAAELIVLAPITGTLAIDGEFSDVYGDTYLFPVLLGYRHLREIIPRNRETQVATQICLTVYNPSSDDVDLDGLKARLKSQHMDSLLEKIDYECSRVQRGE